MDWLDAEEWWEASAVEPPGKKKAQSPRSGGGTVMSGQREKPESRRFQK